MKIIIFVLFCIFSFNYGYSQLSIDTDIKILRAQSDEGNAEAKFFLGALYYSGQGVEQDFSKALKLFEESYFLTRISFLQHVEVTTASTMVMYMDIANSVLQLIGRTLGLQHLLVLIKLVLILGLNFVFQF